MTEKSPSEELFEAEGRRNRLSHALLVAAVTDQPRVPSQISEQIKSWHETVRETEPRFFFDLGYGETLSTAYYRLENSGYVSRTGERTFVATESGKYHLQQNFPELFQTLDIGQD